MVTSNSPEMGQVLTWVQLKCDGEATQRVRCLQRKNGCVVNVGELGPELRGVLHLLVTTRTAGRETLLKPP